MKNFRNGFFVGTFIGMIQVLLIEICRANGMGFFACLLTSWLVYTFGKVAAMWAYQPKDPQPVEAKK